MMVDIEERGVCFIIQEVFFFLKQGFFSWKRGKCTELRKEPKLQPKNMGKY